MSCNPPHPAPVYRLFEAFAIAASPEPEHDRRYHPTHAFIAEGTPMAHDIAVIIGSLRKESWTRKITKAAIALAPDTLSCRMVEIGDLAHYNEDLDEGTPPAPWA